MALGNRLRELLEIKGMKQKDFAYAMNLSSSTVGNYINNLREPDYETLKKIAKYFHVSVDYLLGVDLCTEEDPKGNELLLLCRSLDDRQKELLIAQAKLLISQNWK